MAPLAEERAEQRAEERAEERRGAKRSLRVAGDLAGAILAYAKIGWWGLVAPRVSESVPLIVLQAVIQNASGHVLLAVRSDLRGWELPGGTLEPGEDFEQALRREVREETGLDVEVLRHVGDYKRTGFRPHVAKVYCCREEGGELGTSDETRRVDWFEPDALPATLFPWYREPLARALADTASARQAIDEYQGLSTILRAIAIDLRMRATDDEAT